MLDITARKARRILEQKGTVTAGALARRLDRSQRQVRRLVQKLKDAGIPVVQGRDGRHRTYSIPEGHRRKEIPVRLSPAALRRLYELAKEDDPADPESAKASAEAETALRRALQAEP